MGSFNISAPIIAISSTPRSDSLPLSLVPFHTMYLDDHWTLPFLSNFDEESIPTNMEMSFSVAEVAYQFILDFTTNHGPSS